MSGVLSGLMDISYALVIALTVHFVLSTACILVILQHVERFMNKAFVYMKSNNIGDVLAAEALIYDKPKLPGIEEPEIVPGDDSEVEDLLMKTQKKHRKTHVHSLGAEIAADLVG